MFKEHTDSGGSGLAPADRMALELAALLGNETGAQEMTALVDACTTFRGILRFDGTVRIDGRVEGEIHTTGVLVVGQRAVITARISANAIVSCGRIAGEVTATEKIALLAPAVLKGSIKTPMLSMEEGVRLIGTTNMPDDEDGNPTLLPETDGEELAKAG